MTQVGDEEQLEVLLVQVVVAPLQVPFGDVVAKRGDAPWYRIERVKENTRELKYG